LAVAAAQEHGREPVGQAAVSERSAGALAGAQALVRGLGGVSGKESGPVGDAIEQRSIRSEAAEKLFDGEARLLDDRAQSALRQVAVVNRNGDPEARVIGVTQMVMTSLDPLDGEASTVERSQGPSWGLSAGSRRLISTRA
jgi:hypothetical protein